MTFDSALRPALALPFLLFVFAPLAGCGDDGGGEGTLVVTAYAEDFVEEGISAEEMSDGWAVSFSRFDVTFEDVSVAGRAIATPAPVDLTGPTDGEGIELGRASVPAGEYDDARFVITRVEIEGEATLGEATKTFEWTFDPQTAYSGCETRTRVRAGREGRFEITVHADHLFYDSRAAAEPGLRFTALAEADEEEDGVITQADLEAAPIPGEYDVGSDGGHLENLWGYLNALVAELGHADGEAHCTATPAAG